MRVAWEKVRAEYAKKQSEALARRINKCSHNNKEAPELHNETKPTQITNIEDVKASKKVDKKNDILDNDLQIIIKGLNKKRKELININARILSRLEKIRASMNKSVCITLPLKAQSKEESQELLQSTQFIKIKSRH